MSDPQQPQRFVDAQDQGGARDRALAGVAAGRNRTWRMWFRGAPDPATDQQL